MSSTSRKVEGHCLLRYRFNYYKLSYSLQLKILVVVAALFLLSITQKTDGQFEDWCISDEQSPDADLQKALDWACRNGADCTKIQPNQPCYLPNSIKDHASIAFNSYYQRLKHKGGSCYFNGAALLTALDPTPAPCISFRDHILGQVMVRASLSSFPEPIKIFKSWTCFFRFFTLSPFPISVFFLSIKPL